VPVLTRSDRALVTHAQISTGENVLVTGIGGGVALLAAQLAIARGANVFVTSGTQDKIDRAVELGIKGGVSYRSGMYILIRESRMR
jgi:NADPH:quinone reductase-like Zn-dependent oxidoreductase